MECLKRLDYGAESCRTFVSSRLGFTMRHLENSVCQANSKADTFFTSGKDNAAKGEGWAPPFISCAQDTVGL